MKRGRGGSPAPTLLTIANCEPYAPSEAPSSVSRALKQGSESFALWDRDLRTPKATTYSSTSPRVARTPPLTLDSANEHYLRHADQGVTHPEVAVANKEITRSSKPTTPKARYRATPTCGKRNGRVWRMPPIKVAMPVIATRKNGCPRPVSDHHPKATPGNPC